jgi:hypothetical protein
MSILGSTVWSKDINSRHRLASKRHVGPAGNVDVGKNPDNNTSGRNYRVWPASGTSAPRGNVDVGKNPDTQVSDQLRDTLSIDSLHSGSLNVRTMCKYNDAIYSCV